MMKILIVDDEPNIREGLKYLIDWEALDCQIIGFAQDAYEGLEKIKQHRPDIVISDIKMPYLTGLEMIQKAKHISNDSDYILLSGYSEFDYAKEAIHQGIASYLLKPIEEEELIDAIKKITETKKKKKEFKKVNQDYQEIQRSRAMKEWIVHKKEEGDFHHVKLQPKLQLLEMIAEEENSSSRNYFEEVIKTLIETEDIHFRHGNDYYVIFSSLDQRYGESKMREMDELLRKHRIKMTSFQLSSLIDYQDQLPAVYDQMKKNDRYRFLCDDVKYLSWEKLSEALLVSKEGCHYTSQSIFSDIREAVAGKEHQPLQKLSRALQNYYQQSNLEENEIKIELCNFCLSVLEEAVQTSVVEVPGMMRFEVIENIMGVKKLSLAIEHVFAFIDRLIQLIQSEQDDCSDVVQQMLKYTKKHFADNLTLQKLGEIFGYNSSYLGKKFKKEMSVSYGQYLDQVRIEEAKRMLKETNYLIYEIADKVGYTSLDYFHKKFKANTHMSPKMYRKNIEKD
ncbi:response regulator transcription factor [Vagococcus acidifermentans]|uniref:DNA-binding response regulator n=1 Tax=Vagococcus acidifermentans TaxID=564710 RepID=A0A430B2D5_9ENTE|nr:response regulator [Vagococcus acidifermentans]RSU14490.1 hypothetical protein CBF27_00450 [Vagococcus acidifermentans]